MEIDFYKLAGATVETTAIAAKSFFKTSTLLLKTSCASVNDKRFITYDCFSRVIKIEEVTH